MSLQNTSRTYSKDVTTLNLLQKTRGTICPCSILTQLSFWSQITFLLFVNIILHFAEFLWILTRQRFPGRHLIDSLYKKIWYLGLDTRSLKVTDQKSCPNNPYSIKRETEGDDWTDENNADSSFSHNHPYQTPFEPSGPSYWPAA